MGHDIPVKFFNMPSVIAKFPQNLVSTPVLETVFKIIG
jgi:hypothetical protein